MKNTLNKWIINDCVSVVSCDTKELCSYAREIHNTYPVSTAVLGRTLTGAILLGSTLKNDSDKLTVNINGGGPAGTVIATVNAHNEVKGCIGNPLVNIPALPDGRLDVGGAVGRDGFVTVVKDIGFKEPYVGKTPVQSGEIAEDLAFYLLKSEQQPSIVYLNVWIDTDCSILTAGGIIIRPLPNADDETLSEIEARIGQIHNYALMLMNMSEKEAVERIFRGMELKHLETCEPKYVCDCSRERLEQVIIALGKKEINDMIEEDGQAEIVCRFCNKAYVFDAAELARLRDEAERK